MGEQQFSEWNQFPYPFSCQLSVSLNILQAQVEDA